jgi:16S rRNA (guanine527-N7)-methyltransferase
LDRDADKSQALALTPVSREIEARLQAFADLFHTWQRRMNLVAPSTLPNFWTRHIADSLQLVPLAPEARTWVDLGSGGGFPGIVIACALVDRQGAQIHLVESNQRKAAFLREAARSTGAPATVHAVRIEDFTHAFTGKADVVTARALAPLANLLDLAAPLVRSGAAALFLKGQDVEAELTEAAKYWKVSAQLIPSVTDSEARIVRVTGLQPVEKLYLS